MDMSWAGCFDTATPGADPRDVDETVLIFDALAPEWGVGSSESGWVQWIVAHAR